MTAYLKIGTIKKNSNLGSERDVLEWLAGKISVPLVLDFEVSEGREYILISEIFGEPYSDQIAACMDPKEIESSVEGAATRIRELHDLSIAYCPLDQTLDAKFKKAEENIIGGFVDESDFETENLGKSGGQIYDELLSERPADEDLVFTHGDLCLPNIIIKDRDVTGFIDFDRGGVADRYQDISLFVRSFRFNSPLPIDVESAFCRGYGIPNLNREKLDFYRKLDELF